ncbi:SLIT and NTRK-like protein 4 [Latimeria chalumnae]|uniref:SLIT and NTRK like family member 4 n=1 Tax=Latimeria chalumnae TaxID=7897 RepID=H3A9G9_LATCH|nr:PREDICTED: SLIT and NTRK-like protein 4 [Latimeria chalumnae]|eukprot:XP_005990386.1 PREDICTED: SLIT and NTRK-like protein 4 [Latimeria chalumnae]
MLMLVLLVLSAPIFTTNSDSDLSREICSVCTCMSIENVLYVNCEKITVFRPNQLTPPPSNFYHLNFQTNLLIILYPNTFIKFVHAVSLQLGNNKLQNIEGGAFLGLSALKQLHLNNNELKMLRADTFLGLENLEYLQADYNLIKTIERGAFNKLHKLKVLILNDNLISFLPDNIFRFASLTHLDIRGNRIQKLPYIGVLEHIGRVVELQLEDNPWKCTCDLLPLKAWLENMPYNIYIGEAICETPSDLYGRLLKETNKQELCPFGTGSDFDVRVMAPSQLEPGQTTVSMHLAPTSIHRLATKAPKTTTTGVIAGKTLQRNRTLSQIVSYQTRVPPLAPCPRPCICKTYPSDLGISVNCQQRKIEHLINLVPKPQNARKLYVNGNFIKDIDKSDFIGFEGLDLLHLGSNQLTVIKRERFVNLTNLRRLYLNGNQIERLGPEMFIGLHNLQYLYLEYNVIKEILAGTFDSMLNLQLLHLNNNLLRSLPVYIFAGVPLARLNLKNNHFMYLPVSGVLDQLRSLTQIDLDENPWDCTCDLVALKLWLEKLNEGIVIKAVKCETPVQFANIELRSLKNEILCPKFLNKPFTLPTSSVPVATSTTPLSPIKGSPGGPVPLSILILSVLVVLILTVFVAFCLLVFVLRRNKKLQGKHEGIGNQQCSPMQHQLRKQEDKSNKDGLGGETFIPQTIEQMSKTHGSGLKESETRMKFCDPHGQKIILRNVAERDKDSLHAESRKRLSTIDELDEFLPGRESNVFFQNLVESKKEINSIGVSGFEIRYPEKHQDKKVKKSLIGGNHSKIMVEQKKGEYFELKAKLQGTPDYLQVLEEQTALNKM